MSGLAQIMNNMKITIQGSDLSRNKNTETLKEIGKILNLTRERVRQLESEAISELKRMYDENGDFRWDEQPTAKT